MPIIKKEIVLFKSSFEDDEPGKDDPYLTTLRKAMFTVKIVPVVDFSYSQLKALRSKLLNPDSYSGLVFTSPRAVTASRLSLESTCLPKEWENLPSFVVGEGTARVLMQELSLKGEGYLSGNASALADYILQNKYKKPLLFPCGKLKRDVLPTKLEEGGVMLDTITVYDSVPHPRLTENIHEAITSHGDNIPEFLIYFSSSGVKFSLPILRSMGVPVGEMKIIAIGPTTKTCLEESELKVCSFAVKPSPECLLQAVLSS